MNRILWQPKALRQLRKIKDEKIQQQIFQEVQVLRDFPNCANVKRLTNHFYDYRLRVGNYRVFFNFQGGEAHIVSIEEVKKREMNTLTDQPEQTTLTHPISYQTIRDATGTIQYVVVPYEDFLRLESRQEHWVPNAVVEGVIMGKLTPIRAWREHLGLTQSEVAVRMEISQAAFAQIEAPEAKPRKTTLRRVAQALGIHLEQLNFSFTNTHRPTNSSTTSRLE